MCILTLNQLINWFAVMCIQIANTLRRHVHRHEELSDKGAGKLFIKCSVKLETLFIGFWICNLIKFISLA